MIGHVNRSALDLDLSVEVNFMISSFQCQIFQYYKYFKLNAHMSKEVEIEI